MPQLIGFGGWAKSGKDAAANILRDDYGWVKTYMSEPVEHALLHLDPLIPVWPNHWEQGAWGELNDKIGVEAEMRYSSLHRRVGYDDSKRNVEVRRLLQALGTDVARNMFGDDVWVKLAFGIVDEALDQGLDVVITGIRFFNELDALHARNGTAVWVSRPGINPVNSHVSDNTLEVYDFDTVLHNDGDLAQLHINISQLTRSLRTHALA